MSPEDSGAGFTVGSGVSRIAGCRTILRGQRGSDNKK
jgi:hypothetical protein